MRAAVARRAECASARPWDDRVAWSGGAGSGAGGVEESWAARLAVGAGGEEKERRAGRARGPPTPPRRHHSHLLGGGAWGRAGRTNSLLVVFLLYSLQSPQYIAVL